VGCGLPYNWQPGFSVKNNASFSGLRGKVGIGVVIVSKFVSNQSYYMESITIETTIAADIQTVWQHWTQPEHITNWNFASDDWHCPVAENELRAGGRFSYTMATKDDTMRFDFGGIYDSVIDQQQIAYTLADGRHVTITFTDLGDMTSVTEIFEPETMNPVDMQRDGWQAILNNFKQYVQSSN
jgi:uncharacterized protein YndB with AHSA1/START domain